MVLLAVAAIFLVHSPHAARARMVSADPQKIEDPCSNTICALLCQLTESLLYAVAE